MMLTVMSKKFNANPKKSMTPDKKVRKIQDPQKLSAQEMLKHNMTHLP